MLKKSCQFLYSELLCYEKYNQTSNSVRQDSPVESMGGVDITGFHPPWHSLPEFHVRPDSQDLQFGPQVRPQLVLDPS